MVHEDIDVDGVDPELAALIRECVATDPAERPGPDAVIARCAVSSALAEDPFYVRLSGDAEAVPRDLRAASAAGLVPPGHGAPTPPAYPPTAGPGDWTVVFYHVLGGPTDCESIGCHGFHVGSS
ncbi:putative serine/threonine protein kinase [Streptomyces viridochromogenes Tue57]|uniref:Putative serine/threonine protein kinase n=1 Tax=Streptomyces viridochromogenes Tue57 TaxID=1160705 RepID=L8P9I5_STRVR|nr:putative serine/threonine protein kinase [Streptomyces viridochromogenes Tue57]